MDRGDLVTDEIVIGLIEEKLAAATMARASSSTAFPGRWRRPMRLGDLLAKLARSWTP